MAKKTDNDGAMGGMTFFNTLITYQFLSSHAMMLLVS